MSKSTRLIQMMQLLRTLPAPVTAERLASELGISIRSVYRDVDSLRAAGAVIDGEAGFGYTLVEDPALPPMLFSRDEMEALVLGLREVIEVADPVLAEAAGSALAKLRASLPARMHHEFEHAVLHAKRYYPRPPIRIDIAALRRAAREERAVDIRYTDLQDATTERRVLPLAIVFMDQSLMLLAWCQLRTDFRTFRIDRIDTLTETEESFRPKRVAMLRDCVAKIEREVAAHGVG